MVVEARAPAPGLDAYEFIDRIVELYETRGGREYALDRLSHREHALQAAMAAEDEAAPDTMVVVGLLHDVGHLFEPFPQDIAELGMDRRHETTGAAFLAGAFGPEVTEPIRLHVQAKRFLCAVDESYLETMSAGAIRRLSLQGGPMNEREVAAFESEPYFEQALWLRRLDDRARAPHLALPGIESYRACLEAVLPYDRRG